MNPTSTVLRWYRQSTGQANHQCHQYTAEEVLQLLRPNEAHDRNDAVQAVGEHARRSEAVRQVAARPAAWLGEITKQQRQEIGALADRLPSLLFHHAVGGQTEELVRRFGGWSTWRYERALELAASCIAGSLNQTRLIA